MPDRVGTVSDRAVPSWTVSPCRPDTGTSLHLLTPHSGDAPRDIETAFEPSPYFGLLPHKALHDLALLCLFLAC